MRWDNLFDDLEGQLEQELTAEEVDLQAEEERLRLGRLSIRDRIISLHEAQERGSDYTFRIVLVNGRAVDVRPTTFGRDWFAADVVGPGIQSQCIVPLVGIASIAFTREQISVSMDAVPGETSGRSLAARLSLPFVLRDLCRRRAGLELQTIAGALYGTIDRVGRDHLDLALHDRDAARRENVVTGYRVVPLTQIALVKL
jgi:hypothetical protein